MANGGGIFQVMGRWKNILKEKCCPISASHHLRTLEKRESERFLSPGRVINCGNEPWWLRVRRPLLHIS